MNLSAASRGTPFALLVNQGERRTAMYASMLSLVATHQIIVQNHKSIRLSLGLLATAILWVGCSTAHVNVNPTRPAQIEFDEAVAILPRDASSSTTGAVKCISDAIRDNFPNMRFISKEELQEASGPEMSYLWTDHPEYGKRMAPLGLRYVITVVEQTVQQVNEPIVGAVGGPQAAVTVLGMTWDRQSFARAEVFDVKEGRRAGQLQGSASGSPWVACVGALIFCAPVGVPSFTEDRVCSQLSEAAVEFFSNEANLETSYGKGDQSNFSAPN
jgi:hypothetical protein